MTKLAKEKCVACRPDSLKVMPKEQKELLKEIPGWRIVTHDGEQQLTRAFWFKDFAQALAFTNRVGRIAEQQDHHPALLTEYGKTTVMS